MTTVNPLFVKLCIPSGLEEVLEGLAREVLRRQPENINSFAAVYFDKLLAIRNEAETRGSDMNLPNLIARGKLLDINEEDLLKISIKDETLIDGDDIQPIMVTAAAISKPAQIEIKQPAEVVINQDSEEGISTNTEYENKVNGLVPEGVLVDKVSEESDLVKIVTNQDAEDLEIREIQSEKSSDNSEMDEEEPEVLESELETAIGLQEDQGEGILLQNNENVNFLVKAKSETDVDNEPLQGSVEEMNTLENTNAIFAPGSARALKTEEFQLNDKPSELINENENTELIKYQSDGILSTENEKTDVDEISSNELITSNQIAESGEGLSLKQIEAENDDDNKTGNLQEEEIEEGSLSDKLPTSSEIQEINDDSSITPVAEVDDSVIIMEREKDDIELVETDKIIEGSSSNEFVTNDEILESDKDSSLKPIESEMEDSEDKLVREIDDDSKDSALTVLEEQVIQPVEDIETTVLNEIVETDANTTEIQNEITDNELALIPNAAEKQTLMAVGVDDGNEEGNEARRETDTETNNERNMETQEQTEKGTKKENDTDIKKETVMEEAREDSQDSEVMFTVNEKPETVEFTEIGKDLLEVQTLVQQNEEITEEEDQAENETRLNEPYLESQEEELFEAQAMSQQPEMIREIKINENLTENIVAEEVGQETNVETKETNVETIETNVETKETNVETNKETDIETNEETDKDNAEETKNGEEIVTEEAREESQGSEVMSTNNQKSETSEETEPVKDLLQEQNLLQLNEETTEDGQPDNETRFNEVIVNDKSNLDRKEEDLFEVQAVSQQPETIQEININENLTENIALEDSIKESFQTAQIMDDNEQTDASISQEKSLRTTEEKSIEDPEQNDEKSSEEKISETLQILEITPEEKQTDKNINESELIGVSANAEEVDSNITSEESSNQQIDEVQPLIQEPEEIGETGMVNGLSTVDAVKETTEETDENSLKDELQEIPQIVEIINDDPEVSTIKIEDNLPEKSADQIEENVLADELQEVFQSVPIPEDDKQSEVDGSRLETTISMKDENKMDDNDFKPHAIKETTDETEENVSKDKLQEISQPVENITDDAQEITEINPENSEIAKEENLLQQLTDQNEEKSDTEMLALVQDVQQEEPPETENGLIKKPVDETDEEIYKSQTMTVEYDEIEGNTLENEFEENSQTVQNTKNNEQIENSILDDQSSEKIVALEELTDKIEEKALDEKLQEVLQPSQQQTENGIQSESETNQMESSVEDSDTLKTDSNLAIDASEKLADVALESANLREDGNLAYEIKTDVDVSGQITYDTQVSASADEGQETEGENKAVEERNDNEPVNTEEIVDTQSVKVNDILRTEAPDRDADDVIDQIQNADELEMSEGKPEEVQKTGITSLLQNGELEEPSVEKSSVIAESEDVLSAKNLDEINDDKSGTDLKISKDIREDEIMVNSENVTQLNTDSNQNTTEGNDKEFQQNVADSNEDDIQLSDNAEKQTNDVQDIDRLEETAEAFNEEGIDVKSILEEPESQKEISTDEAMIQDENSDDVVNKENDIVVTEETLSPKTILKTEEVFANLVNESEEKSKEIENEIIENTESVEIPIEGSMEIQNDGLKELNQKLDEEILEENAPLDSILPDESQIINEDANQIETPKEGVAGEQTNQVKAIENEEAIVDESMSSLSTSNEQNQISDQSSEPLKPTDQSTPEQVFQMESQTIQPTNLSNIEVESNAVAEITKDDIKDDEQEKQITEIAEELIMPEVNQQLTSELVDNFNIGNPDVNIEDPENVTSQIQIESNQPLIVLTPNDDEIRNESTNNSGDIEIQSNNLNNIIEEQTADNLNDEILEIENNAIIEMDSLEYENKRAEEGLSINEEVTELDSLEYIRAIEETSNQTEIGQELDSLEISNTMPEIQELESSSKIEEININEENPKLESEQTIMATDQESVIDNGNLANTTADSPMDVTPSTNAFNNIQSTSDNGLESEEKIDVQLGNSIIATETTEGISSATESKVSRESDMADEQPVKEAEVAQEVSNEPDFEQTSDEKIDQDRVTIAEEESTNDLPVEESTNNLPEEESTNDLPEEESTNDLPEENDQNRVLLQASIPQNDNFNYEMQIVNSDEQVDVISGPESEGLILNNDEALKTTEDINADDDDGKMLESSEEKSSATNTEAALQASEFEIPEQTEISNETANDIDIAEQRNNESKFVNDDIPAISEEIVMKEIVSDLETNIEGNLESISEMQADDLTNTSNYVEEEVIEPEIIKETEQLDEPNFTELYNKLENSLEENSNETMSSENHKLELNDPENIAMDESIIDPNEIGEALKTADFKNTNEVDEQIIEGSVQLEEPNETVVQNLTEANVVPKEEAFVTEEEIKPDVIENVSNEQAENIQNEYKEPNVDVIVETLIGLDNNKEDEATDFDQTETLNEAEDIIQNEEEILKEEEEEIQIQEENLKEDKEEIQIQEENLKEDKEEIQIPEENLKEEEEEILIQEEDLKEDKEEIQIQEENLKEDKEEIQIQEENLKEDKEEIQILEENLKEDKEEIQIQEENLKEEEEEILIQKEDLKEEEGGNRNLEEQLKEEEAEIQIQQEKLKEDEEKIQNQEENGKKEEEEIQNLEEILKAEVQEIQNLEASSNEEEEKTKNLESQETSTQSEEILTEKGVDTNIQENIDKDLLLLNDKLDSKETTLESENDESTQVSEIIKTENSEAEKLLETSEATMLEAINTNEFETDKTTEESTTVEKIDNIETNLNDETLAENNDNDNVNKPVDNNDKQPVDDSSSKTTTGNENIESTSPSKEIVEEKVPEPMSETSEIFELGKIQNSDELQSNDIQKNGDDNEKVSEFDNKNEENPVMSEETLLLKQDVDVDKSTDLPDTNLTAATEQSLEAEEPLEPEPIDVNNTLTAGIDDTEAPILSEELRDESIPENQIQEKDEVAGNEQNINDNTINDEMEEKIQETLQEGRVTQLDAENDIGEVMAFLDGQTDEIETLTDLETDLDEARNKLSNKAQIRDGIPKTTSEEQRKQKEQDKNDVRGKEQVKEETSINGFEILGHSIVLKPKKNVDKTDANIEQEVEEIVDKTQGITSEGLPNAYTDDNKNGIEMGTKDFVDINGGMQDQSDTENTINEGDDQDEEDNDVMIGQGLTSPPEEQITAINNLVP